MDSEAAKGWRPQQETYERSTADRKSDGQTTGAAQERATTPYRGNEDASDVVEQGLLVLAGGA